MSAEKKRNLTELSDDELDSVSGGVYQRFKHRFIRTDHVVGTVYVYYGEDTCGYCGRTKEDTFHSGQCSGKTLCESCYKYILLNSFELQNEYLY